VSEPPNISILIGMRLAVHGGKVGMAEEAAADGPLFFLFILIFYYRFLDSSNFGWHQKKTDVK